MKKLLLSLAIVTLAMALFCSINVFALTEGDWEFELLDDQVKITGYIGTGGDVVIPETIYGCPVTQVYCWSTGNTLDDAISITYPKTVKVINNNFTAGWTNNVLKKVVLPEGVEEIGWHSFSYCKSLETINIPSTVKVIGDDAFIECINLKNVSFPAGLETIGEEAFYKTGLTTLDLSHTKAVLGEEAFVACESLKSVRLPQNLEVIPHSAFFGCVSLNDVEIPATVHTIENYAFRDCKSLDKIILPVSLKKLYEFGVFSGCDSLKEIVIPYGTTHIGGHAFEKCPSLKAVYIPDTVTYIGNLNIIEESPNAIIYCTKGSKIAEYCKDEEISYLTDNSVNTGIHVFYNGTRISFHSYGQNPELLNSRTLVPLRSIFEAMGATVTWDDATSTATSTRDGVTVSIQIGANEMYKNGESVPVDVPAQLMNDRTMVPVRVIAEAFGAEVLWNGNGNAVFINE